ncbi:hypothetical protein N2384_01320 [Bacillus paralicheniformis]|uniref:hypothetical protein n=1 Tax=Bacillus paralicheniformis TaxID=1648923 RepID=UPI0021A56C06|nr:hypothetical protein [Bacillus paralicheniformis]UWS61926.1 hypothetical protein N2384_01320 [Bacillus paralicheniformis]
MNTHELAEVIEKERVSVMFITTALFNTLADINIGCIREQAPICPLDLHVLGTPPAFVLSQDQTLQ